MAEERKQEQAEGNTARAPAREAKPGRAAVEEEKRQIEIDLVASGTTERNAWRRIEGLQAALDTARSNERRAAADFARAKALIASHAISQSSYDQLKSAWETAAASVTSARRALDAATVGATRADLSRLSSKGTADGMRLSEIADTRASIRNRTLKVAQLEAEGRSLEADLDALEVEKNRLTLRAPEDGKVLKLMYEPGEIVPAGTPAVLLQTDRS